MNQLEQRHRLADWFRQWRLPLRKFLIGRGTVPASDIDDVAQEVFLRLMRYGKAELIEHPQAYLYKMAANVAAEWAIQSRYTRSRDQEWVLGSLSDEQSDPGVDQASQVELQDDIEQALMSLTPQQRLILKLQFYGGLTRSEVAAQTGLSERSVKRALLKSYEKLRRCLNTDPFPDSIHE